MFTCQNQNEPLPSKRKTKKSSVMQSKSPTSAINSLQTRVRQSREHRLTSNCQSFDWNISRNSELLGSTKSERPEYSDADISRLIAEFDKNSKSSGRGARNEEYKRRLVHLALYRSELPKFKENQSYEDGSQSFSNDGSKTSSERSLQPKSVWSEETPKLANLSSEKQPHLMQGKNTNTSFSLKPLKENNGQSHKYGKKKRSSERVKYCMTEKNTTLKFLYRLATNHFDMKEYASALEVFEEVMRILLSQLKPEMEKRNELPNAELIADAYYNVAICHFYLKG